MQQQLHNYIDGQWTAPSGSATVTLINPATEESFGSLTLSGPDDLDRAVAAARRAFASYSRSSRKERMDLLKAMHAAFARRREELAHAVTLEIGCPDWLSRTAQATLPETHIKIALESLAAYAFDQITGNTLVRRTPVGVCGLITPWNWPAGIIIGKVAPALATGCTMVLKPSEYAPLSARIVAEALHDAGVPPGVFNMAYGDGPAIGASLAAHADVDCISFTGSTSAGVDVAVRAAPGVKRVLQELGGKSPNIVLPSADVHRAVKQAVHGQMINSGQNCYAPSRLIVPAAGMNAVRKAVLETAAELRPGPPESGAFLGPVVSAKQYASVIDDIRFGLEEGAELLAGGPDRPEGLEKGYFIRPTVFARTTPWL